MVEPYPMPAPRSLAEAIRDAVRVGDMGPNSSFLLARGHSVALTPQEAEDASKRLTPWVMSFVDTLVAQRLAERSFTPWQLEAGARAAALVDDYDGCFERVAAWDAATQEQRDCGEVEEPMSTDAEDCEFWRKRVAAAFDAAQGVARAGAL